MAARKVAVFERAMKDRQTLPDDVMHPRAHVGERIELGRRIDHREGRAQAVLHQRKLSIGRIKLLVELHELGYVRRNHTPAISRP